MKKYFILSLAILFVLALSAVAFGGLASSVHDLRSLVGDSNTALCGVCHSPHGISNTNGVVGAPLWGHVDSDVGYTMYQSDGVADVGAPSGISKLCLGCHDGVTALSAYTGYSGTNVDAIVAGGNISKNLQGTHPISTPMVYGAPNGFIANVGAGTIGITPLAGILDGGNVECSTCHDVHNNSENGETVGTVNLLRSTMSNSALCTSCHVK